MRGIVAVRIATLVLVLGVVSAAAEPRLSSASNATATAKRKAAREGWPDTPVGARARGWVEAFSTGEDAMRAYLKANMSERKLAKRTMAQRTENYRKLRERYGKLMLASVTSETQDELKVTLMASDASTHGFVFAVEREAPHLLASVSIVQKGFSHGGGGFHH